MCFYSSLHNWWQSAVFLKQNQFWEPSLSCSFLPQFWTKFHEFGCIIKRLSGVFRWYPSWNGNQPFGTPGKSCHLIRTYCFDPSFSVISERDLGVCGRFLQLGRAVTRQQLKNVWHTYHTLGRMKLLPNTWFHYCESTLGCIHFAKHSRPVPQRSLSIECWTIEIRRELTEWHWSEVVVKSEYPKWPVPEFQHLHIESGTIRKRCLFAF
jgi:hypothetical protein